MTESRIVVVIPIDDDGMPISVMAYNVNAELSLKRQLLQLFGNSPMHWKPVFINLTSESDP